MKNKSKHYKILFEHSNNAKDEYAIESAWAEKVEGYYKLDNILFYAPEYSWGDIVNVEDRHGELYVTELVQESGHSTVRILFSDEKDVQPTRNQLKQMGCDSEISDVSILISVDIPPTVSYSSVKQFLETGELDGKWGYEEACIAHDNL